MRGESKRRNGRVLTPSKVKPSIHHTMDFRGAALGSMSLSLSFWKFLGMLSHLLVLTRKDPFQKQNLGPDLWKLCPSLSVRNAITSPGLPGMWKLSILFPSSRPVILEYLGSDGNRVPHFLWGCRILSAHCSVRCFIQCGIWHLPQFPCCLTRCQGGRIGSHAYCLPITQM
jgi:hypothetical protein